AYFGFGSSGAAYVLLSLIVVAATLESVLAFCLGFAIFGVLMRWGVIPDEVCERCNDIWGGARGRAPREDRLPEVGRVLDEQRRVPPYEREPQRDAQHARGRVLPGAGLDGQALRERAEDETHRVDAGAGPARPERIDRDAGGDLERPERERGAPPHAREPQR